MIANVVENKFLSFQITLNLWLLFKLVSHYWAVPPVLTT